MNLIMDVGMFDVRYLKVFNAHYGGEDDDLAEMLYAAQDVSIVYLRNSFITIFRLYPYLFISQVISFFCL